MITASGLASTIFEMTEPKFVAVTEKPSVETICRPFSLASSGHVSLARATFVGTSLSKTCETVLAPSFLKCSATRWW
jgi:hypothetical protein